MNYAIAGQYVRLYDLSVVNSDGCAINLDRHRGAFNGLYLSRGKLGRGDFTGNDVVGQKLGEGDFVFGLEELLDGACG